MVYTYFTLLLLEDFCIIQSAEILYEYHNVALKIASSMMTVTRRNYIKCLSTSCVICRHVSRGGYELYAAYSPQTSIRQEEEVLPFVPSDKAFISTWLPSSLGRSSSSKDVHSEALLRTFATKSSHVQIFFKILTAGRKS